MLDDAEKGTLQKVCEGEPAVPASLPRPRRELLQKRYIIDAVQVSRGCRHACGFCCIRHLYGPGCRTRPLHDVLDELRGLGPLVGFLDENLVADPEWSAALFEAMIQEQPTYALHLIAHNLDAEVTVMDYPRFGDFLDEVRKGYDIVAVGSVVSGLEKARRMLRAAEACRPGIHTVCGGPGAMAIPEMMPPFSHHLCRGDGITFMRELLGQPPGMERVEREQREAGERFPYLSFMVYDENFLLNRPFVDAFRRLNRERALRDPQFLLFTFSDAAILGEYDTEELLEIGIDTIWVGVESPALNKYGKMGHTNVRALLERLTGAGIKVIASAIAGLEEHDEAAIRRDMEIMLSLPTTGVQYMPVNPIPGTAFYRNLAERGLIRDREPRWFNMSHYNLRHPTLDEATVKALLDEYFDHEMRENGPLVYRFLRARWQGWQRFHDHPSPWMRGRARLFRGDLFRGIPVLVMGERLAASRATRADFRHLRREVQRAFGRRFLLGELWKGRHTPLDAATWWMLSLPGLRPVLREGLATVTLRADPRRTRVLEPLTRRRAAIRRAGEGTLPWPQPEPLITRYSPSGG